MSTQPSLLPSSIAVYDERPFFEKALQYGVQTGLIDSLKLDAICADAPKGMVQIARYFGSEFLRPELEKAKERMVNLVSLYLESSSGGDLRLAAESLQQHSFLSRSKGGSDMLKALIGLPQNSHFGMSERSGFNDDHIPLLAKWSLRSYFDYQAELAKRSQVALVMDAAIWLADRLGMGTVELEDAGKDAEAVLRTALLSLATGRTEMPDWVAFEKMLAALRKQYGAINCIRGAAGKASGSPAVFEISVPKNLPDQFRSVVEAVRLTVLADLPKILDATLAARTLFDQTPAFMGRYFWIEDALSEVDHHDRLASLAWNKVIGDHSDDGSLLTLFLCVAAQAVPKTLLTEKGAATLIRKIQKKGLNPDLAHRFILDNAPATYQNDYSRLWADFVEEAQNTLQSDSAYALKDALSLLRRECRVK